MNLDSFPRRRYTSNPTQIQELTRLSNLLGGPRIFIKRDDLLGLAGGGNKTRKLEFLVADALSQGADTLITCGAIQSNHCRLTLSAANTENLKCQLVLQELEVNSYRPNASGNHLLDQVLGVENIRVVPPDSSLPNEMHRLAQDLVAEGRKPYVIPIGGSNAIGTLGYVAGGQEILQQVRQQELQINHVVCASGSAGTQAGLVTAFRAQESKLVVQGITVSRDRAQQEAKVLELATQTSKLLNLEGHIGAKAISCNDEYVGAGYSLPTDEMVEAVKLVAQTESILLDPVYTGKAMAGLIGLVRKGFYTTTDQVLFLHTGGSPALYAHSTPFFK
jgi:D-cysteine desulfhydrase